MKRQFSAALLLALALGGRAAPAQEATSGIGFRATVTAQTVASNELTKAPRSGSPVIAASRSVLYPTIKFNDRWFIAGALQVATRPYFYEDFSSTGYGAKGKVLQASINYARISDRGSLIVRAGQMPSAFGSFLLRYDDTDNPLINIPVSYGYYYAPVSVVGVFGAQADASRGRFDGRLQFANSSPANPRSIFARDQYGNWAGGAGFTIRQGMRVGVSGYRGPYLDRTYAYYYPGEANPSKLPAYGRGIDGNWAHGHTMVNIELQKFVMPYTRIPRFRESAAYGEFRQVLSPRWFVAARYGYSCTSATGKLHSVEAGAAYRPNGFQLIKLAYDEERHVPGTQSPNHTLGIQFITVIHGSLAFR
jgi:hypothetical protein